MTPARSGFAGAVHRAVAVLSFLVVLAGWLPAPVADAQRVSDVRGTKHNLSTSGSGTTHAAAGGTSEVCVFCHTPHGATTADDGGTALRAPLWNRRVPPGVALKPSVMVCESIELEVYGV
jgi:hypothetical protein